VRRDVAHPLNPGGLVVRVWPEPLEWLRAQCLVHDSASSLARSFGEVRLGAFGYWGKEKGENDRTNRMYYWGPDLALGLGEHWQFSAEYLERRDDDPFYANNAGDDLVTRGGFAELHFFPKGADGRWILTGLYNNVDSDDVNARSKTVSLTGNYLLSRNVRLLMEAGRDIEQDKNRVSMGLITAF